MGLVQQYLTTNLRFSEGAAKGVVLEVKKEIFNQSEKVLTI